MGMLVFLSYSVQAQEAYPLDGTGGEREGSYTPVDGDPGSHVRDSDISSDEFADADTSTYNAPVVTGATGSRTSPAENEDAAASGDQESVLGFNFLYYIIQKFKMSDIVEK